ANQLAHVLRDRWQVHPDDRVGLLLDRSELLPVAVWGILKSGAAYVPVDPTDPPERAPHGLEDSQGQVGVTRAAYLGRLAGLSSTPAIDLREVSGARTENPRPVARAGHLAYVIYTSGSTGVPKGCQIELGNLLNYLRWANDYYFEGDLGG